MQNPELVRSIEELARKLRTGEVTLLDLLLAVHQRLIAVSGTPHYEEDPDTIRALTELAVSTSEAFRREFWELPQTTMEEIGRGVAEGVLGADFFKNIKVTHRR
jgi:hypothetical protein